MWTLALTTTRSGSSGGGAAKAAEEEFVAEGYGVERVEAGVGQELRPFGRPAIEKVRQVRRWRLAVGDGDWTFADW